MRFLLILSILFGSNSFAQSGAGAGITQFVHSNAVGNVTDTLGLPVNVVAGGLALDSTVSSVQGSSTGGTAASKSSLSGGIYNFTTPTLTTGQQSSLQLDSSANLKVNVAAGALTVTNAANGTNGAAAPTVATQVGGSDGTNLRTLKVSTTGVLSIDGSAVTQPVSQATGTNLHTVVDSASNVAVTSLPSIPAGSNSIGTVSANQSGTWNITNVTGTVSLPTGASTSALQTSGNATLTTISGQLPTTLDGSGFLKVHEQGTVPIKAAVSVNGSGSAAAATVSTVTTLTAPANAVGFVLQNLDTSSANIRWAIGRTAATNLGQQLQPGRDTGFVPCGANVSIIAESGTQNYDVQWISQ